MSFQVSVFYSIGLMNTYFCGSTFSNRSSMRLNWTLRCRSRFLFSARFPEGLKPTESALQSTARSLRGRNSAEMLCIYRFGWLWCICVQRRGGGAVILPLSPVPPPIYLQISKQTFDSGGLWHRRPPFPHRRQSMARRVCIVLNKA